jgi:hypothetical protein
MGSRRMEEEGMFRLTSHLSLFFTTDPNIQGAGCRHCDPRRGSRSLVRDGAAYRTQLRTGTRGHRHQNHRIIFPSGASPPRLTSEIFILRAGGGDGAVKLWEGEVLVPGRWSDVVSPSLPRTLWLLNSWLSSDCARLS